MRIYLPWIQKRISIINNIFSDIFGYIILLLILNIQISFQKNLLFILYYVLISYLIGRYHLLKEKRFQILLIEFTIIPISLVVLSIFELNKFFLYFILMNFFLSVISKFFFNDNSQYKEQKTWHLIGFDRLKDKNLDGAFIKKIVGQNLELEIINDLNCFKNISKKENGFIIDDYRKLEEFQIKSLLNLRKEGFEVISLLDFCDKNLQRYPSLLLSEIHILSGWFDLEGKKIEFRIKRISELFLSILIILISSPLIFIAAFLIYLEDKGPIIYSQIRTGLNGKSIKIYKLRTMKNSNDSKEIFKWAIKDDPRVTFVGNYLRKFRIDELPQLYSVIKGEMSLIGPRPEIPSIEKNLRKEISFYDLKFFIKPGLSGWAQVNYPYGASVLDSNIKLSYDLFYIKNFSIWLDILIFFKTLKLVINGKGAIAQENKRLI